MVILSRPAAQFITLQQIKEGKFHFKINPSPEIEGKYWIVIEFDVRENITLESNSQEVIHQIWELKRHVRMVLSKEQMLALGVKDTEQDYYIFEFMGRHPFELSEFTGRELGIPIGIFNVILHAHANTYEELVPKFNETIGLDFIRVSKLPGLNEYGLGMLNPHLVPRLSVS